jgi:uncharacterized Tic20 family protein
VADQGSQKPKPDLRTAVADAKALATVLAMQAESVLGRRAARVLGVLVLFAVVVGVLLVPIMAIVSLLPFVHAGYAAYRVSKGEDYRYRFAADLVENR